METNVSRAPESLVDTGEAMPLPRSPSGRRLALEANEARKRRMANILVICSSVVAIAVIGIAYALVAN
jgi:hypothetical protein